MSAASSGTGDGTVRRRARSSTVVLAERSHVPITIKIWTRLPTTQQLAVRPGAWHATITIDTRYQLIGSGSWTLSR